MNTPNPPTGLSESDRAEWCYIYTERLGISCEDRAPTMEQIKHARQEADRAVSGQYSDTHLSL